MSETKHTPGPWSLSWIAGAIRHINRNVDFDAFWFPTDEEKANLDAVNYPSRNEADYRLIAAAPEMLAALQSAPEVCEVNFQPNPTPFEKAYLKWMGDRAAALAKARGIEEL